MLRLSKEDEAEIIDFYLKPNMIKDVAIHFNLTVKIIKRILKNNNIQRHGREVISELRKKTYLEHYGVEHPMFSADVKNKMQQTCLERFGVSNVSSAESIKLKKKTTCLERYGVENPNQVDDVKEKKRNTCLKKYGVETPFQSSDFMEKAQQTCLSKYGCLNPLQSEEIKLKAKRTCLKKYGVENYTQTTECKNKSTETNIRKYGVKYYAQSIKFHKSAKKQFRYLEDTFDSFPELCLFIYAKTNGVPIKRAPVNFHFIFGGIDHWYIPDFEIDGELIEIKGDHFVGKEKCFRNSDE